MSIVIFSGGVGLGAYQAGAYERLVERPDQDPIWVAGSSIGAINAAIIAGNARHERMLRLREFWSNASQIRALPSCWQPLIHAQSWASALITRVSGNAGNFMPRMLNPWQGFKSFYDLSPLAARLSRLVDFDRLNDGSMRITVATTDLENGDIVLFDSAQGDRIVPKHLLASCGFLPEFAPVEIDGRLLGDGGLSANAPIEALSLDLAASEDRPVFVIDLFARDGERPSGLESALSRKNDLIFGNQTWQRLRSLQREQSQRPVGNKKRIVLYLSYRPRPEEAGPERVFDYSRRSLEGRWKSGFEDMEEALVEYDNWRKMPNVEALTLKAVRRKPVS